MGKIKNQTPQSKEIHNRAVKIRKMTDEELVERFDAAAMAINPPETPEAIREVLLAGGISCQDINDAFSLFWQAVRKRPKAVQCQHCGINISMGNEDLQWYYSLSVARWKGVFCLCDNCFDKLHEFLFPQKNGQL